MGTEPKFYTMKRALEMDRGDGCLALGAPDVTQPYA